MNTNNVIREEQYIEYMRDELGEDVSPLTHDVLCWPDSQYAMGEEGIILINDELGYSMYGSSAYVVPKEITKKLYPKFLND